MSLFNKFSVSHALENVTNKKISTNKDQEGDGKNNPNEPKEFLGEDVLKPMLLFGFTLDQIMQAFKLYKFTTVDEAVYYLMRDTETGKFNHWFFIDKTTENRYEDIRTQRCYLCGEGPNDHNDLANPVSHTQLDADVPVKREEEIKDTSFENEKSTLPMIKSADLGGLLERRQSSLDRKRIQILQIEIPKEALELFEDPEVCRICFSEVMNDTNKASFPCGHKFCITCVNSHLSINISNGKVLMIKCLSGGCPKSFVDEEVREYVSPETFFKYRKFKIVQLKLSNPKKNYINCPFPDCEEILDLDSFQYENSMMECPSAHKFCARCKTVGWHKVGKCNNYDDSLLSLIQKNSDSSNYKQCPQCSIIIEKNEGCNQMKCANCTFDFCWLCLNKYTTDHYAIYNFTGCPGMRFNTPKKKKWWNNPYLKILWYISSFFLGILAICCLILFFAFFGCCYEFVKCYVNRTPSEEDNYDIEYANRQGQNPVELTPEQLKEKECKENTMIGFLIFLGVCCQPLYLMFYVLYAMMECYRRFSCWFYYSDY